MSRRGSRAISAAVDSLVQRFWGVRRSRRRSTFRAVRVEPLETRQLMTVLYYDASDAPGLQAGNGTWSTSAACWNATADGSGARVVWTSGADAVFAATGTSAISVSGTVSAASMAFNGTGYTLNNGTATLGGSGNISAPQSATINSVIAGTAGLSKSGAGTLTLKGHNTYTGTTWLNGGNLSITNANALGSGNITFVSDTTLQWNSSNTNVDLSSRIQGIPPNVIARFGVAANDVAFSSGISGAGSLYKQGSGSLTFQATNSYTGSTRLFAGTTYVNGSLATSDLSLAGSATLGGTGSIAGPVSLDAGATILPGAAGVGILHTGGLTLASGATASFAVNGNTAGTDYGQVQVTGTVSLSGAYLSLTGARTSDSAQEIILINNDGSDAVVGTFANYSQDARVTLNGIDYTLKYNGGDGNDVTLRALTAPTNLVAAASLAGQIDLSWQDNAANESGFAIDRATDDSFTQILASWQVPANSTSYQDTGLATHATYWYRVRAINGLATSGYSNAAGATTVQVFHALELLTTPASATQVTLSWDSDAAGLGPVVVQRSDDLVNYYDLTPLPDGTSTFTDSGLSENTTVRYRVYLRDVANTASSRVQATTYLAAPTALAVTSRSTSWIALAWTNHSTAADSLQILARNGEAAEFVVMATLPTTQSNYTITGLPPSTNYTISVVAINAGGNSSSAVSPSTTTATLAVPAVAIVTASANQDLEGAACAFSASVDAPDSQVTSWSWTVAKTGDASFVLPSEVTTDSDEFQFAPPDNGTYIIGVTVIDDMGSLASATALVAIGNVAPIATLTNSGPTNTADAVAVGFASISDPSAADTSAAFHYSFAFDHQDLATSYATASDPASKSFIVADSGTYTIYGRIFDKDGDYSDYSTDVTVSASLPAEPTDFGATATSSATVHLTWSDSASEGTEYVLEKATDSQFTQAVEARRLAASITSYDWTDLSGDTSYYFRIKASNAVGDSGYAAAVTVATLPSTTTTVWFDDSVPDGASSYTYGGDSWTWVTDDPTPFGGSTQSHQSAIASGIHQQYFDSATQGMTVGIGDTLYAYAYIDPANPPAEIMLQWNVAGSWEHRAFWGPDDIGWGARTSVGSLPSTGEWVRLEVPASAVGLEGQTVTGMAFTLYGGRVTWGPTGVSHDCSYNATVGGTTPQSDAGVVYINGSIPSGSSTSTYGGDPWTWVTTPTSITGTQSHVSALASGLHQHYFDGASQGMTIHSGDTLFAYVYLDPANMPSEVMLQFNAAGSWEHRAFWGIDQIGCNAKTSMGDLPAGGQWVRLTVPASAVGLEGQSVTGIAFTLWDGRATWGAVGRIPANLPSVCAAPTDLSVVHQDDGNLLVSWADHALAEIAVVLEMSSDPTFSSGVSTQILPAGTSGTVLSGLADPEHTYFRVKTRGLSTDSDYTGAVRSEPSTLSTINEGACSTYQLNLGALSGSAEGTVSQYILHWGDGSVAQTYSAEEMAALYGQVVHSYTNVDGPNTYQISIDLVDEHGTCNGVITKQVCVLNVAPVATPGSNGPVLEGSSVTVSLADPLDPSAADTAAGFHYSYALTPEDLATSYDNATDGSSMDFAIADVGSYTVYARIFDKDGGYSEYSIPVTVSSASLPADSEVDFSGVQGQGGWFYGYFAKPGSSTFVEDVQWTGSAWQVPEGLPCLTDIGGHPGPSYWSVRRWIANADGAVVISGNLSKIDPNGGNGIIGHILINGTEAWSTTIAYNNTTGIDYSLQAIVQAGDTVDFCIDPNGNFTYDYTRFTAHIAALTTLPDAPDNLAAQALTAANVTLSWTDNSDNEAGFIIERGGDALFTQGVEQYTVSANSISFNDTNVSPNTAYYYRVRAANALGQSANTLALLIQAPRVNTAPTIITPAAADVNPVTSTTATLAVLGDDDDGEEQLAYCWSALSMPSESAPRFSSASSRDTTVTFDRAGTYVFRATITDVAGLSVTSDVTVQVSQSLSTLSISTLPIHVGCGRQYQFSATALDQFGIFMPTATIVWSVDDGGTGTIDQLGLYTAAADPSTALVRASAGELTAGVPVLVSYGPSDLTLSSVSIPANQPAGTIVGTFAATDASTDETFTYALVDGVGSTGNASFTIYGDQLRTVAILGSAQQAYSIRVRVTDSTGLGYESVFNIDASGTNASPVIMGAQADACYVRGTTVALSVDAADDADESNLVYTWALSSDSPGGVSFSCAQPIAATNTTATFTQPGTYTFQVTATDKAGLYDTDTVTVEVDSELTAISVSAASTIVENNATCQFAAAGYDQFGLPVENPWGFGWRVMTGDAGFIDSDGLYIAPLSGTGSVTVRANSGSVSGTCAITLVSATKPAAPSGLVATKKSAYRIDLAWTDHGSNETAYVLEQATDAGFAYDLQRYDLDAHATKYSATGLLSNVTYYFRVRAVNTGGESDNSNIASDTTSPANQVPAIPADFTVTGRQANQINLAWSDVQPNSYGFAETSYQIERATDSAFSTNLTRISIQQDTTGYSDTGLTADTTYYYRLRSVGTVGWSAATAPVHATAVAPGQIPSIPDDAGASATSPTAATLSVSAYDDAGQSGLTYTWSLVSGPEGAVVTFDSINATNAASSIDVSFAHAGNYVFDVSVTDQDGLAAKSSTTIHIDQVLTDIQVTPAIAVVADSYTQPFTAVAIDQFGDALKQRPELTWSVSSGAGAVTSTGIYTAPGTGSGSATISASSGSISGLAAITYSPADVAMPDVDVVQALDTSITLYVLANDIAPQGATLSITAVTQGSHGTLTILSGTGTGAGRVPDALLYLPSSGFSGADSFSYTVADGQGHTYTAPVTLQLSAGTGGSITQSDATGAPGALNTRLNTGYDVSSDSLFVPTASGNYGFTKVFPATPQVVPWSDASGIAHNTTNTASKTLTVFSFQGIDGSWIYNETMDQTTESDTTPAQIGASGTTGFDTVIDHYEFVGGGDVATSSYTLTAHQTDLGFGTIDGESPLPYTQFGDRYATITNAGNLGAGTASGTTDQHGWRYYDANASGTYEYDTDGGQVNGTTPVNSSHWSDTYNYTDTSGTYVYKQTSDSSYNGSGTYDDGNTSGNINENGGGGSSATYVFLSQLANGVWTKTGLASGYDSDHAHWFTSGTGTYSRDDATSSVQGTNSVSQTSDSGSDNSWRMNLDVQGQWHTTYGSGGSHGTTTNHWSYIGAGTSSISVSASGPLSGGGSYNNTDSSNGTIHEHGGTDSTSGYTIHSDWSANGWVQTGSNHSSSAETGFFSAAATGDYTHTTNAATASDANGVTAHSTNDATISGTTDATHVANWDSNNSLALTLGADGVWAPTSGFANSNNTTTDNSDYSGDGDTSASNSTSGPVTNGSYSNSGNSDGSVVQSGGSSSTVGYSIHSQWTPNGWANTGQNSYDTTSDASFTSGSTGTYTHATNTATSSNSGGTIASSNSHSTVTGGTNATYVNDSESNGGTTWTLGTDGNWSVKSGQFTYSGGTYSDSTYQGDGSPDSHSSTRGPLTGAVGSATNTFTDTDDSNGTVIESGTTTQLYGYSTNSDWDGSQWTQTGDSDASSLDHGGYTSGSTDTYTHASNSSTESTTGNTTTNATSNASTTNTTTFIHLNNWDSDGWVAQSLASDGDWVTSGADTSDTGTTSNDWRYSSDGGATATNTTNGPVASGGNFIDRGGNHGSLEQDQSNTFSQTYSLHAAWSNGKWNYSGDRDATTLDVGSLISSSTGGYTHTTNGSTSSNSNGTVASSTSNSSVTGTTGATHIQTWNSSGAVAETLVTPPVTSTNPTPSANWSTAFGDMTYAGTTTDNSSYSGAGPTTASNTTTAPIAGTADSYTNSGDSSGTNAEGGTTSYNYTYSIHSNWQTDHWHETGTDLASTLSAGSVTSSSTGHYTHISTGSSGSSVSGTTGKTHINTWDTHGNESRVRNAPAPKTTVNNSTNPPTTTTLWPEYTWQVASSSGDSTATTRDDWNYGGSGSYAMTPTPGSITESATNGSTTNYSVHTQWDNSASKWTTSGNSTATTLDSGSWTASGATAAYNHEITGAIGTIVGTKGAFKARNWNVRGSVTMTLSTPAPTTDNANRTASWATSGGAGDSTSSSLDGWSYSGSGPYDDGSTTGTLRESGTSGAVNTYSVHAEWNSAAGQWTKSGSKGDVSLDKGSLSKTGSGPYSYPVSGGVLPGTTSVTTTRSWAYAIGNSSTWLPTGGPSQAGGWSEATGVKDVTFATLNSTSSHAAGSYSHLVSTLEPPVSGGAEVTVLNALSQSYTYHTGHDSTGAMTYSGSGDATSTSVRIFDYSASVQENVSTWQDPGDADATGDINTGTYTESGHHDVSTTVSTKWNLDRDGTWQPTLTHRTGEGDANDSYSLQYDHTNVEQWVYHDCADNTGGYPRRMIYENSGNRAEGSSYDYDYDVTQTAQPGEGVTITGTGQRSGTASGNEDTSMFSGSTAWHWPDPAPSGVDEVHTEAYRTTYTYAQGGDLAFDNDGAYGPGADPGSNHSTMSIIDPPGYPDPWYDMTATVPGFVRPWGIETWMPPLATGADLGAGMPSVSAVGSAPGTSSHPPANGDAPEPPPTPPPPTPATPPSAPSEDSSGLVSAPGFWEGLIPIWGSGKEAIHDFSTGHYIKGTIFTGLAVWDAITVATIIIPGVDVVMVSTGMALKTAAREGMEVAAETVAKTGIEQAGKVGAEAVGKGATKVAAETAVKTGTEVAAESSAETISRVAQQVANTGEEVLKTYLKPGELKMLKDMPWLRNRILGTAVHRGTDQALKELFPGKFKYNPSLGPDFYKALTREWIELTTQGEVLKHMARPGYDGVKYALYTLQNIL